MPPSSAHTAVAAPDAGRLRPPRLPRPPARARQLTAALAVAVLLVHLLLAQVTLVLSALLLAAGRLGRWRPSWLAVPAAAGIAWIAATGARRAAAGFAAGPRQVAAFLAGAAGHPGRLGHVAAAFAGAGHWLPRQLPVALVVAAAEAAAAGPVLRARAGAPPAWRPGLLAAGRRRRAAAALSAGLVVTRDGAALGLERASGCRAEISWAEAAAGVLAVGADPPAAARVGFPLAAAAARRRMAVIVVDLAGSSWLADSLAGACADAGAPLHRLSPDGPAWYEPFRSHPPRQAAALAAEAVSWAGTTRQQRQAGQRYLADAFAVLAVSPGPPAVLDALIALLEPARLRAAGAAVPGHLPHREALAVRVAGSAAALETDPALAAALAGQLRRLRASGPGRWRQPPAAGPAWTRGASGSGPPPGLYPPGAGLPGAGLPGAGPPGAWPTRPPEVIQLGQAVRDRSCVLFSLGPPSAAAAAAGRLAVADLCAVLGGLRDRGLRGDSLAWVHGCDAVDRPGLAALLGLGPATGTAVLLSTAHPAAAARLAPAAGLVVAGGPADPVLAGQLAGQAQFRTEGAQQDAAAVLRGQAGNEFAVIARGARFQPGCQSVPAAWAGLR
jgi:hypothetical protein